MPFEKENNYGKGRPKGSSNKVNEELREILENVSLELINNINLNTLTKSDRIKLLGTLLSYVLPKLRQTDISTNNPNIQPLDVHL